MPPDEPRLNANVSFRNAFQANDWPGARLIAGYRYIAMAGSVKDLPPKAQAEADEDRAKYGGEYLSDTEGAEIAFHPPAMIRFLVDICDLPYDQACLAAQERLKQFGIGEPHGKARHVAKAIYRSTGDIFEALATVRFFVDAAPDPTAWQESLECLQSGRVGRSSS